MQFPWEAPSFFKYFITQVALIDKQISLIY